VPHAPELSFPSRALWPTGLHRHERRGLRYNTEPTTTSLLDHSQTHYNTLSMYQQPTALDPTAQYHHDGTNSYYSASSGVYPSIDVRPRLGTQ